MNTQRDLKIAEAMKLECKLSDDKQRVLYKDILGGWRRWNPEVFAEQREMVKAKLKEWGYRYSCGYSPEMDVYWFHLDLIIEKRSKLSESEAFLEAVGELCLILKNQTINDLKIKPIRLWPVNYQTLKPNQ